jgi:cell division protein FtsL
MSAAYSRRQETIRQYREEPSTRAVTRQVSRPVTRPITRQVSRPVTRPITRQVSRPVTRPITRQVSRPVNRQSRSRNNSKPQLRVVQPVTRSKFSKVTLVIVTLASLFGFIVIFQTVIAEQQLRLDRVSTDVRLARQHYNELRQQRAELRAPDYLRAQAIMLGMWPGSGAKFEEIPAEVVTMVLASTGEMDDSIALPRNSDELVLESTGSAP